MAKRREFIQVCSVATAGVLFTKPLKTIAGISRYAFSNISNMVTLFHTNDLHGNTEPFTIGKINGLGGLDNVTAFLKKNSSSHILLDAGDFLNDNASITEHKKFIDKMNKTGYHAAAVGNRELSNGQAYLASLIDLINFKLINCNYEFSDPVLKNKIVPYHIIKYGAFKIGITGIGIRLNNSFSNGIVFHPPYQKANETATYLKKQLKCNLVICLSHLGFDQKKAETDNKRFAVESENIDVIISGHNDAIKDTQLILRNKNNHEVIISHAGWGGLMMGKLSLTFDENRNKRLFRSKNYIPGLHADKLFYQEYQKIIA